MSRDLPLSDDLLSQVGLTSDALRRQIEQARQAAVRAVRAIEDRLVRELRGERLRGMPNLAGDEPDLRFFAVRVRSPDPARAHYLERLPEAATQGPETLVLLPTGKLAMARRERLRGIAMVTHRDVRDDELTAEDAAHVAACVVAAARRGIDLAADSRARFAGLAALADRLAAAANAPFSPVNQG